MKRIFSALEKTYSSKQTLHTNPTLETTLTQNTSNFLTNQSNLNQTNNNSQSIQLLNKTSNRSFKVNDRSESKKRESYKPFVRNMGKKAKTDRQIINIETDYEENAKKSGGSKMEYHNRLSLERINFMFDDYGTCADVSLQASALFFKFLAMKPDLEIDYMKIGKRIPRLKLYIPDTIVINDMESTYWVYTDSNGCVRRTMFSDQDVIEKFKSATNDDNEILAVYKIPINKGGRIEENHIELLNIDELERYLFSKNINQSVIQRFVKCRGPKAFVCRTVWRRTKPPYVYILTNKKGYQDDMDNKCSNFVVNTQIPDSFSPFYATSGKHLEETHRYMTNIVKFIESHSGIIFEELVGDFVKDEAGIWWFINLKAMKVQNFQNVMDSLVNLEFFTNRPKYTKNDGSVKKIFDAINKIKCKFCGIEYKTSRLKYKLTSKMIFETDKMLKHLGIDINWIDRPDLKHDDSTVIYLPYRVCEDCYLLFETMNDIKNYQIEIANYFRNPVDPVNFGVHYYMKNKGDDNLLMLQEKEDYKKQKEMIKKEEVFLKDIDDDEDSDHFGHKKQGGSTVDTSMLDLNNSKYSLYRMMFMFTDFYWKEKVEVPKEELYLIYDFLGKHYKVKLGTHYECLNYFDVNFFKIYYFITDEQMGFIEYVEKNKYMIVKLGYFVENKEKIEKEKLMKRLRNRITYEDQDVCTNIEDFVEFASVELSMQGLKYGPKYRNILNGLLFKKTFPHFVGNFKLVIRINKEKSVDLYQLNLTKYCNFFLPSVHYVIPDDLPLYWLDMVEKHKNRQTVLEKIMEYVKKKNIIINTPEIRDNIFKLLELSLNDFQDKIQKDFY